MATKMDEICVKFPQSIILFELKEDVPPGTSAFFKMPLNLLLTKMEITQRNPELALSLDNCFQRFMSLGDLQQRYMVGKFSENRPTFERITRKSNILNVAFYFSVVQMNNNKVTLIKKCIVGETKKVAQVKLIKQCCSLLLIIVNVLPSPFLALR